MVRPNAGPAGGKKAAVWEIGASTEYRKTRWKYQSHPLKLSADWGENFKHTRAAR